MTRRRPGVPDEAFERHSLFLRFFHAHSRRRSTASESGAEVRVIQIVRKAGRIATAVAVLLLAAGRSRAQTTGRIEGSVRDPSGAALPGVAVEAEGAKLQGVRRATTDGAGRYRLPELPPGAYAVRAVLSGYSATARSVIVGLDTPVTLDLLLEIRVTEEVAVSAETRLLDVSSTTAGTSYTRAVTDRLPVARNYADVVRANPGVSLDKGETQGRALPISIYGATSVENQWLIDGVNTTNVIKGFQGKTINNEFVEEVEVKTGGYSAEYGGALGGIVNVVTRSGGNEFHGDGFFYYDSNATTAERKITDRDNIFGMKITPDERRDYGVDLGGYFVKDRLWFFGAYNRVEIPGTTSRYFGTHSVPSTMLFPRDEAGNLYSGKLTWNFAPGSSLVGTAFSDPSTISGAALVGTFSSSGAFGEIVSPDPGTWLSRRKIGGADYGARWSQLLGAFGVLAVQASRHQDRFQLIPAEPDEPQFQDATCLGGTVESPCPGADPPNAISGGVGLIDGALEQNRSRRNQLRGDGTLYAGDHEFKTGVAYQNGRTDLVTSYTGGQIVSEYNEFGQTYFQHDFFSRSATDLVPTGLPQSARSIEYTAYLQDSWRLGAAWTVTAGVRWGQQELRNASGATVIKTGHEWQPRLGVSWDPTGRGATKISAFVGRFYYSLPTSLAFAANGITVEASTVNFSPTDVAPDPRVIGHPTAPPFVTTDNPPVDSNLGGNYQDELTLALEKLLDPTFSIALKGTYRRVGRAVEDRCDLDYNQPENNHSSCAIINPGSGGRYARGDFVACTGLNGDFNTCSFGTAATPEAKRVYRGIEILVNKTIQNVLWLQASYVYSSLEGNFDGQINENFGTAQTDPGHNADFDFPDFWYQAYGRLFLDRPHSARLDASYTTPFGLFAGLGAYVQSGAPISKRGYFNEFYGGANIFLLPRGEAGTLPTLWEASVTVGYPVRVGPATVTLQGYVYNLFNNQIETNRAMGYTKGPPNGYPATLKTPVLPPDDPALNPNYGHVLNRQEPRLFRAAIRVSF